jgi:hypothetical protein
MEAVGRCGLEIVSRWLTRCGFSIRRFASNFPTKLCISFGSAADLSAQRTHRLGTLVYRIQRNVHRPVTAAPSGDCGTRARHYEE